MAKEKKRFSLILQVAIIFAVGVVTTGIITYFTQYAVSEDSTKAQVESFAKRTAGEVRMSLMEYPAYRWLTRYWYEHADTMDIEYDVSYESGTATEEKSRLFASRHPGLPLKYVELQDLLSMPEEDQKLYAEIAYSWLITRINQIKRTYGIDFLFCVVTEEPYDRQFFLFSAADRGAKRGTNYEEVYPLGTTVEVDHSLQQAMKDAKMNSSHLADAGKYVDYYAYLDSFEDHTLLIGMTYNLTSIINNIEDLTRHDTGYAIGHQILLSLVCLALIYFFVLRPLKKVQRNIRLYKGSKDSEAVIENLAKIHPHNEIGQLSEDVSDLTKEIEDYVVEIEAITAERERIGAELALATRIQSDMIPSVFPPFPGRKEFDIYATMDPAREVGGDFYDFFLTDEDHLCIVMADVSGKGIPAALFMMASKIILANNAMMGKFPAKILEDTNATICSSNREEMFVTVWLGILEISTGKLTAANAGHEYPLVMYPNGKFVPRKERHGFVIGGMDGTKYTEYEMQLEPGSKLFLYTDGVPEATDAEKQMFGMDRLLDALNKEPDATVKGTLENVRNAVNAFVQDAEQFDDLTMLCLSYAGLEQAENAEEQDLIAEAKTENLDAVLDYVNVRLDELGCTVKARMQINVAVDEIFSNIARYAYAPGTGKVTVRVEGAESPRAAVLTFTDWGVPYDPLKKADPDVTLSAEEREIGGLGIFLVKKTMDDMVYEYKDGKNILTIRKNF